MVEELTLEMGLEGGKAGPEYKSPMEFIELYNKQKNK